MTLTSIRLRQRGMTGIEIQSPPLIPPRGGKQALPPPPPRRRGIEGDDADEYQNH